MDHKKIRRQLLSSYFDTCAELRQTIIERGEFHKNGHRFDCKDDPCQADPLFHLIVRLNRDMAIKRQVCLAEGIEKEELGKIKAFFSL